MILDEFQWLKAAQPALDSIIQRHWDRWDRDDVPITLVLSRQRADADGAPARTRRSAVRARDGAAADRAARLPRRRAAFATHARAGRAAAPLGRPRRHAAVPAVGRPGDAREERSPRASCARTRRSTTSHATCCAKARESATRHVPRDPAGDRERRHQHNAIAQQAGVPTANLARKLERLEDLGYVTAVHPLGAGGREAARELPHRRPLLPLLVPLPRRQPQPARVRAASTRCSTEILADLDNHMGWAFEQCCRALGGDVRRRGGARAHRARSARGGRATAAPRSTSSACATTATCSSARASGAARSTSTCSPTLRRQQDALGPKAARASSCLFGRERFTARLRKAAAEEDVLLVWRLPTLLGS